jgi:hypothetical protein
MEETRRKEEEEGKKEMIEASTLLSAKEWAVLTYGSVQLGDQRRTERAVALASEMARNPGASLPAQMGNPAATKAAYRFFENPKVSYDKLIRPHLRQTQDLLPQHRRILLIQDTTEVDFYQHPKTSGLSQVGKKKNHQGYLLQTVLAVEPSSKQVLGIAAQEPFLRQAAPVGETSHGRSKRPDKESQVWLRQVESIGSPAPGCQYIHVGDRGSDIFAFLRECQKHNSDFLVRVQHDRCVDLLVDEPEVPVPARRHGKQKTAKELAEPARRLFEVVRSWPSVGQQTLHLDGNQKRQEREATLCISFGTVRFLPPDGEAGKGQCPMRVTIVRAWEPNPPDGAEAIEWMLITSVQVQCEQDAWERVEWYRMRWIVEDYHQCLKTGCLVEKRQIQTYEGLRRLLGFLAPLALRLLQLRSLAREGPEQLAKDALPPDLVKVVAHLARVAPDQLTMQRCWRRIAQAGGHLGRKGDGEPGWKTLWKGWLYIQTLLEGVSLASRLSKE